MKRKSNQKEIKKEEEMCIEYSVSMDAVTNDEKQTDKQLTKVRPTPPMEKNIGLNRLVLNINFDTKEDYDYVNKLCNNQAIFWKREHE